MANMSGFKGGVIIVLVAGAGLTYWNRSSDASDVKTQCLSQFSSVSSVRNPEVFCGCYVNELMRRIGILHFVPVVRNFQSDPSEAIVQQSTRVCMGG